MYVSPEAIAKVMSGLKKTLDLTKDHLVQYSSEKAKQEADKIVTELLEEVARNLLATGATTDEINELFATPYLPEYSGYSLGDIIESIARDANTKHTNWLYVTFPYYDGDLAEDLFTTPSPQTAIITALLKLLK